ncbi:ArsR/SmtB family transcription factor [Hyphococcus lacteus]|uniref:Metalloregulator ArsR/SmtB family transcription factor n=1 Tax=Hyphococcus lacteus TaxID=3143536 RepID=A0ABV3Z6L3_9PROT
MSKPMKIADLKVHAQDVSALLKTLSHANRLLIACALTEGEKNVSQIESDTKVPQPLLSRDLGRLRDAGLISARRESKNVYYSITDPRLSQLVNALCNAFAPKK